MDQPPRRAIYPKGNTLAVLRRLFMEGLFHCTFAEFISSVCKLHLSCQISSLNSMFCNDASYFSFKSEKSREVLHLVVQQIVLLLVKVKSFSVSDSDEFLTCSCKEALVLSSSSIPFWAASDH